MNNSARILIPVGLFVAFAFAHMMATKNELVEHGLVIAKSTLSKGSSIDGDDVELIEIYSSEKDVESINRSFVQHGERGKDVLGRTLNRDIQPGEFIMLADLLKESGNSPQLEADEVGVQVPLQGTEFSASQLKIGSDIGFTVEERRPEESLVEDRAAAPNRAVAPRLLHPFRLIGIGDEVISIREAGTKNSEERNSKILTIAVKPNADGTMDENTSTLLQAVSGGSSLKIISVVVLPEKSRKANVAVSPKDIGPAQAN